LEFNDELSPKEEQEEMKNKDLQMFKDARPGNPWGSDDLVATSKFREDPPIEEEPISIDPEPKHPSPEKDTSFQRKPADKLFQHKKLSNFDIGGWDPKEE